MDPTSFRPHYRVSQTGDESVQRTVLVRRPRPEAGTMAGDGLVRFDDGTAPAHAPAASARRAGPVMVLLDRSAGAASFRETGAPAVLRLFEGDREDLEALGEAARAGERALAAAAVALGSIPTVAALYMGLS